MEVLIQPQWQLIMTGFLQYIITNLGISNGFGTVSETLQLPATMSIDWIRVYQPADNIRITCDPEDFPTASYIKA